MVMPPATSHSDCSRNDNRASNEKPHVCPPNFTALNLTLPRSGLFRRIERWLTNSASAAVGMGGSPDQEESPEEVSAPGLLHSSCSCGHRMQVGCNIILREDGLGRCG